MARWLESEDHDVFSVFDEVPGISDHAVIQSAYQEERILVTNDKDFGDAVYRQNHPHHGVVLLRLDDERSANKISVLERLLETYGERSSVVLSW